MISFFFDGAVIVVDDDVMTLGKREIRGGLIDHFFCPSLRFLRCKPADSRFEARGAARSKR